MQYRAFGKTGIRVPILGFGAMRLPTRQDGTCDEEVSVPILRRGIDLGITYIDTAQMYINGTSEAAVGKAIKGCDRGTITLCTKIPVHDEEAGRAGNWRKTLETSLARFDTPYIDCILFHSLRLENFDSYISRRGQALESARQAQDEGLVRQIGFSSHDTPENIMELVRTGEFSMMLVQYDIVNRRNEGVIQDAAASGMGVAVMGPLAGGNLTMPGLFGVEQSQTTKTAELALRFVWNNPGVHVALSGMNDCGQVDENCAAADRLDALSEGERSELLGFAERNKKLADLYCTGCGYCMPCPNDVNIPENLLYMNMSRIWGLTEKAKSAYARLDGRPVWTQWAGNVRGLKADACVGCEQCLPKCPQKIAIVEQLKEVVEELG